MIEPTKYPIPGKQYKHYKGGLYTVITLAKHSETNEDLVICKSDYFGTVYARPLKIWFDLIVLSSETEPYKSVSRFEEL